MGWMAPACVADARRGEKKGTSTLTPMRCDAKGCLPILVFCVVMRHAALVLRFGRILGQSGVGCSQDGYR